MSNSWANWNQANRAPIMCGSSIQPQSMYSFQTFFLGSSECVVVVQTAVKHGYTSVTAGYEHFPQKTPTHFLFFPSNCHHNGHIELCVCFCMCVFLGIHDFPLSQDTLLAHTTPSAASKNTRPNTTFTHLSSVAHIDEGTHGLEGTGATGQEVGAVVGLQEANKVGTFHLQTQKNRD